MRTICIQQRRKVNSKTVSFETEKNFLDKQLNYDLSYLESISLRTESDMSNENRNKRKHHLEELKGMVQESKEPKDKVFAIFCHRHGISLEQCKEYYDDLVNSGEIKEK